MAKNKKGQEAPAENRANQFELFDLSEVVMTPVEEETPIPQDEAPAAATSPALPEGWTLEDIRFLIGELDKGTAAGGGYQPGHPHHPQQLWGRGHPLRLRPDA